MKSLIVEDDFPARKLLQIYLAEFGKPYVVINGRGAVETFRSALESGEPFDLICLDIMMPHMNGIDALREIRQIEQQNSIPADSRVKIIMTTADQSEKDIEEALTEGCDAYIIKPIRKADLLEQIARLGLIPAEKL